MTQKQFEIGFKKGSYNGFKMVQKGFEKWFKKWSQIVSNWFLIQFKNGHK